ncbi:MAG TPA: PEP-CTERM sorting domain-containing protein [Fimbriimonadaceae bacterium]|nr:PEP-CTERM sorting domain-containing protein [Fimbriimonadaceae bacterium]
MKKIFLLSLSLSAASAFAGDWNEIPDAPDLVPGQITVGAGSLDRINGAIGNSTDADLYCIYVHDFTQFRATTVGQPGSLSDTQLFLFNANGLGVTFNDDSGGGARSTLTSTFLTYNGIYFIGVSGWDRDATSVGGEIWADTPFTTERAPDGPGAASPLSGWAGTGGTGTYSVLLNGASFHVVPEPGTMIALAGGLGALLMRRRRNAK